MSTTLSTTGSEAQSSEPAVVRARRIMQINNGYFQSKVLQSAVELGVFDFLARGPATLETIRAELGIQHRLAHEYLNALVGMHLLDREGDHYRNGSDAAEFLVADQPTYLGGTAAQHAKLHYHAWSRLTDSLRDGHAKSPFRPEGGVLAFTEYYQDLDRARTLMTHVDAHNRFFADEIARRIDWGGVQTLVDIGGARGNVAALMVKAHPHLRATVMDLPALEPLFDELMQRHGTQDTVTFHGGDFFNDPWPRADALLIGHVLPDWPDAQRRQLVRSAFDALRPGGMIVAYDALVDEQQNDLDSLLRRINSMMIRDDHTPFSVNDCRSLLEDAGFRFERVFVSDSIAYDHMLVARKPE